MDNIKMGLKGTVCEDVDWMHMTQNRDHWWVPVNTVLNLRFPYKAEIY